MSLSMLSKPFLWKWERSEKMSRHLLSLAELTTEEAKEILNLSLILKKTRREKLLKMCSGMSAALIFEKPSTRTRVSLDVALSGLGAVPVILSTSEMQLSRGEDLKDTARVLSRYVDAIVARVFKHETLEELAKYSNVPVVNALSDVYHPLQAIADVLTIYEGKNKVEGIKLAYIGDGNNVCHSLIIASALYSMDIRVSTPQGYEPKKEVVKIAENICSNGFSYAWFPVPEKAVKDVDVVYTDTWISMGSEEEKVERLEAFKDWQVNVDLMSKAKSDAIFMHCLPAHKGEEVTDEVFESKNSVVFDQAENRLHTARAVFIFLWKEVG